MRFSETSPLVARDALGHASFVRAAEHCNATPFAENETAAFGVSALQRCWVRCLSQLPRPWLLVAGDSNWRHIFTRLRDQLLKVRGVRPLRARQEKALDSWDERWFDDDVLLAFGNRSFRLSLRFLWDPLAVLQRWRGSGLDRWARIHQCGPGRQGNFTCMQGSQPEAFSAPRWTQAMPHGMIFAHGLWGLPHRPPIGCAIANDIASELWYWAGQFCTFRWATNFPIASHPSIEMEDVEVDVGCQRSVSDVFLLPVLDVSRLIRNVSEDVVGSHFVTRVADAVIEEFMSDICSVCVT